MIWVLGYLAGCYALGAALVWWVLRERPPESRGAETTEPAERR